MSVRCGNCKNDHDSSADVRKCYTGTQRNEHANRPAEPAPEGVYRYIDSIYRVVARPNGKRHAEELVNGRYVYARGVVYKLRPEYRLSLDDARTYGKRTGTCIRCGIELHKPESIEAGIGPICAGKI